MKLYKCIIKSCTQCGNHVEIRNDIDFSHFLCSALRYKKFLYGPIPNECPLPNAPKESAKEVHKCIEGKNE